MNKRIKAVQPVMPFRQSFYTEIESIWDTGILTNNGEKAEKFKKMLSEYLGCPYLDLFVNGHSALLLGIKALGLEGEVITSPFTFVSTTNAIMQNNLIPVFGDIDESYNLTPESIADAITPNTSAIITPHIFGIPCKVEAIAEIAQKFHLKVIYDGAQAFGTRVNGESIGKYGDLCMFSFHAVKVFNSIEGGMITYRNKELGDKFERYRNFGIDYGINEMDVALIGINAKMNEFQAAMGIVNLPGVESEIERRKAHAELYCCILRDVAGIETYGYEKNVDYNYAYFPIKIGDEYGRSRDELYMLLKEKQIGSRKLYDKLTYEYSCYRGRNFRKKSVNAEHIKNITLDLPIYGSLKRDEIEYICDVIRKLRK